MMKAVAVTAQVQCTELVENTIKLRINETINLLSYIPKILTSNVQVAALL